MSESAAERYLELCDEHGLRPISNFIEYLTFVDQDPERAQRAACSLSSSSTGRNLTEDDALCIGQVMQEFPGKVHTLDISNNDLDATAVSDLLRMAISSGLHALVLSDNPLGDEGAVAVAEALAGAAREGACRLGVLVLARTRLGVRGLSAVLTVLARVPSLYRLDVQGNDVGHRGAAAIVGALSACPNLRSLAARACGMGSDGIAAFVGAYKRAAADGSAAIPVGSLDLGLNDATETDVVALLDALLSAHSDGAMVLEGLDLSGNDVGDGGAEAAARLLSARAPLSGLSIDHSGVTERGAAAVLAAAGHSPTLRFLSLRGAPLGREAVEGLAASLARSTSLLRVVADGEMSEEAVEGVDALADGMEGNTSLVALSLGGAAAARGDALARIEKVLRLNHRVAGMAVQPGPQADRGQSAGARTAPAEEEEEEGGGGSSSGSADDADGAGDADDRERRNGRRAASRSSRRTGGGSVEDEDERAASRDRRRGKSGRHGSGRRRRHDAGSFSEDGGAAADSDEGEREEEEEEEADDVAGGAGKGGRGTSGRRGKGRARPPVGSSVEPDIFELRLVAERLRDRASQLAAAQASVRAAAAAAGDGRVSGGSGDSDGDGDDDGAEAALAALSQSRDPALQSLGTGLARWMRRVEARASVRVAEVQRDCAESVGELAGRVAAALEGLSDEVRSADSASTRAVAKLEAAADERASRMGGRLAAVERALGPKEGGGKHDASQEGTLLARLAAAEARAEELAKAVAAAQKDGADAKRTGESVAESVAALSAQVGAAVDRVHARPAGADSEEGSAEVVPEAVAAAVVRERVVPRLAALVAQLRAEVVDEVVERQSQAVVDMEVSRHIDFNRLDRQLAAIADRVGQVERTLASEQENGLRTLESILQSVQQGGAGTLLQ